MRGSSLRRRVREGPWWQLLIVASLAMAPAVLHVGTAQAHALLKSSNPAAGANLSASPSQLLLTFTEPPDPGLSSVALLDSNGQPVKEAAAGSVPGHPTELQVPITSPLAKGVYTVSWRTVSRTDGHVTGGSFAFGIGTAPPRGGGTTSGSVSSAPPPSWLAVIGRWAFYWGLALLVGGAAVGALVARCQIGRRWMFRAAWLLSAAGLVAMTLAERSVIGISLGRLLGSGTGTEYLDRGVALVLVGAAIAIGSARPSRATLLGIGALAAGALLVHAIEGHAGAPSSLRLGNIADEWLHLVAVGVWVGGLPWLLVAIHPTDGEVAPAERATIVHRFSRLATVALAVTIATGVLRALAEVGSLHELVSTSFGVTLLIKAGLVAALVALGAHNHFRRVPHASDERHLGLLRRTVKVEVAVGAAILLAAAILSQLPPASKVSAAAQAQAPAQAPVVVTGHDFATTTRLRLSVAPGTVGSNTFTAEVTDFDTGAPAPATSVQLAFRLPSRPDIGTSTLDLVHVSGATWRAKGSMLSIFGTYSVQATVQLATSAVTVPLEVRPKLPPEQISVNRASGQPTLYTIALQGGGSLQAYVDPGTSGPNAVHFTFFEASGSEMTIASATASMVPPGGASEPMKLLRFDQGHFAANVTLTAGTWIFQIAANTGGGASVSGYFSTSIGGTGG